MAVSIAGLRRNIKNVAHNYTDAQVRPGDTSGVISFHFLQLGQSKRSHK